MLEAGGGEKDLEEPGDRGDGGRGDSLYAREKAWLLRVLEEESGNRTATARRLGISVRTVRNKLAEYAREAGSPTSREATRPSCSPC